MLCQLLLYSKVTQCVYIYNIYICIIYIYIHTHSFSLIFHHVVAQEIEHSSLCCTAGASGLN